MNPGDYLLRNTATGETVTATVRKLDDGTLQAIKGDSTAMSGEIICLKDGSYRFCGDEYVFEPIAKAPEPTTEPQMPTELEPTTEPETKPLRGDVDANGIFELSDLIMMQKYLLGVGTLNDYDMGDMLEDNILDIFDLGIMKRELLEK